MCWSVVKPWDMDAGHAGAQRPARGARHAEGVRAPPEASGSPRPCAVLRRRLSHGSLCPDVCSGAFKRMCDCSRLSSPHALAPQAGADSQLQTIIALYTPDALGGVHPHAYDLARHRFHSPSPRRARLTDEALRENRAVEELYTARKALGGGHGSGEIPGMGGTRSMARA